MLNKIIYSIKKEYAGRGFPFVVAALFALSYNTRFFTSVLIGLGIPYCLKFLGALTEISYYSKKLYLLTLEKNVREELRWDNDKDK